MADEKTGEDSSGKTGGDAGGSGAGYGNNGADEKQKGETEGTGDAKE
ncbi:hypothetical protein [Sphingomonas sp.]